VGEQAKSLFYVLEDRIDERRQRGRLGEDQKRAHDDKDRDHRQQPKFLVLFKEQPKFV